MTTIVEPLERGDIIVFNLPVRDLDGALPFCQTGLGFGLVSRSDAPRQSAVIGRRRARRLVPFVWRATRMNR